MATAAMPCQGATNTVYEGKMSTSLYQTLNQEETKSSCMFQPPPLRRTVRDNDGRHTLEPSVTDWMLVTRSWHSPNLTRFLRFLLVGGREGQMPKVINRWLLLGEQARHPQRWPLLNLNEAQTWFDASTCRGWPKRKLRTECGILQAERGLTVLSASWLPCSTPPKLSKTNISPSNTHGFAVLSTMPPLVVQTLRGTELRMQARRPSDVRASSSRPRLNTKVGRWLGRNASLVFAKGRDEREAPSDEQRHCGRRRAGRAFFQELLSSTMVRAALLGVRFIAIVQAAVGMADYIYLDPSQATSLISPLMKRMRWHFRTTSFAVPEHDLNVKAITGSRCMTSLALRCSPSSSDVFVHGLSKFYFKVASYRKTCSNVIVSSTFAQQCILQYHATQTPQFLSLNRKFTSAEPNLKPSDVTGSGFGSSPPPHRPGIPAMSTLQLERPSLARTTHYFDSLGRDLGKAPAEGGAGI
ncbi:hypothetical protein EV421DRAFT_1742977 [Armillaria borealis]|uniref:Uncharacterized protein n=1 Tax=Armillaria borealis TaxID=47425 RepID=A0AA39MFA2_9AGAR|nr:hypothetical protein EV421DRAFT_1742977 [Armillaria borealis]